MRLLQLTLIGLFLFNYCGNYIYAQEDDFIERRDIVWFNPVFLGSVTPKYHYMLEFGSAFNNVHPILQGTVVRPAVIYEYNDYISFWFGYAFFTDLPQREIDTYEYENRIWEELFMLVHQNDTYSLFSRTRIEQREDPVTPQWSVRFRQQYTIAFSKFFSSTAYAPFITDEILLNFNNPEFVGERFVDENRLYIGIGFTLTQSTFLNLAYTNQVQFGMPKNRINHILSIQLTLNLASPRFFIWATQGV